MRPDPASIPFRLRLRLPRDARYVPLMRHLAEQVLDGVGVPRIVVADVAVAVSEACANAVRHATRADEYSVSMTLVDGECQVEVVDMAPPSSPLDLPATRGPPAASGRADPEIESGRGIYLMRSLVDDFSFNRAPSGTRVRLVKRWPTLAVAHADSSRRGGVPGQDAHDRRTATGQAPGRRGAGRSTPQARDGR